ncbi:MAG: hypothetical protein HC804_09515, partial [Anaerolineae bacterium]|nr:hypothetical protein [Anaerolineae bacterium]
LFALNSDGTVQWQRSLADVAADEVELVESNGRLYLITQTSANNTNQVTVYTIDIDNAHLTRLFVGGSRTALTTATWSATANEYLLVNIGGGHLVALDPLLALQTVQP